MRVHKMCARLLYKESVHARDPDRRSVSTQVVIRSLHGHSNSYTFVKCVDTGRVQVNRLLQVLPTGAAQGAGSHQLFSQSKKTEQSSRKHSTHTVQVITGTLQLNINAACAQKAQSNRKQITKYFAIGAVHEAAGSLQDTVHATKFIPEVSAGTVHVHSSYRRNLQAQYKYT